MLLASVQLYRNAYQGLPRKIWWLSLVMLVNRAGTMVIPFLTVYLTDMQYSRTQAGYAMAAFGAGAILGSYLGGRLTDRFGFFYVQVFSLLSNSIMFIVLSQMRSLESIIACMFLLAVLGETFRPANSAAIAAYSDESNRIRCYSLNRLAINLGFGIGPAVGGMLAEISFKWVFWVDSFSCMTAALLMLIIFSKSHKSQGVMQKQELIDRSSAFRDKHFLQGMFLTFVVVTCFFQIFSIVPIFYHEELHMSKFLIGIVLSMNGLLIFFTEMVLVYKLENRYDPFFYIIAGTFLIGASFLVLNIAPVLPVVLFSMLLITLGEMLMFPFINNFWVKRSNDRNRGQYASVYTMAFAAAHVFAPTFSSAIAERNGFFTLWIVDFAICTLAMTGFIFLQKKLSTNE
jgi:predicted MFS family arabinose efflux permease